MNPNRTRTRKTRFDSGSSTKLGIASCCRFMLSLREYQKRSVVVKAIPITSLVQLCKFGGIKTPKICVQNKPTFLTYFVFLIFCRLDQKFQPAGSVPLKRLNRSVRSVRKTLDRFQIWPEALKKITWKQDQESNYTRFTRAMTGTIEKRSYRDQTGTGTEKTWSRTCPI
jgi:hypothetical protein